jgi:hypothetical protein
MSEHAMSIWTRIKRWRLARTVNEDDTPSTTGTGANGEFVGRVAGDDADSGVTGAEVRTNPDEGRSDTTP